MFGGENKRYSSELFDEPFAVSETATLQPRWYAGCTLSRHEKQVAKQLEERAVSHFLPMQREVRRWKNGKHQVELPLFPGYIFVFIAPAERIPVLKVPGFARFVSLQGRPVPVPDADIEAIRKALQSGMAMEPCRYLATGSRVEICSGPLEGVTGIVSRRRGRTRVIVSVEMIQSAVAIEVDNCDLRPVGPLMN